MRISIWQQFSSNHSASFEIVGKFETYERANEVAEDLRHILRTVSQWWAQHSDADDREDYNAEVNITPPEVAFSKQYDVKWARDARTGVTKSLDWVPTNPDLAGQTVKVFENLVFVKPDWDSWLGPRPLDDIMRKLGGEVATACEGGEMLPVMTLICSAPDEHRAAQIFGKIEHQKRPIDTTVVLIPGLPIVAGQVSHEGNRLTFHLRLNLTDLRKQVLALLDYVRAEACTDIEYAFTEVPDTCSTH